MEPLTADAMYLIVYFAGLAFAFTGMCLFVFASNTKRSLERIQEDLRRTRDEISSIQRDTWRYK